MLKKVSLLLIFIIIALFTVCGLNPEIPRCELKSHIVFLASDSLKGRYPGTDEIKIATDYIKPEMVNARLKLLDGTGLQEFEVTTVISRGENNVLMIEDSIYQVGKDFVPYVFTVNMEMDVDVVFAGYGFNFKEKV